MIRFYRHPLSGHSHRVELLLTMLDLPFERVDVDILVGAHQTPEFLAKNPFGQLPVIEDGDRTLADSNAILTYLALRYDPARRWLPADPVPAAQVQRWLSLAAGPLASGAAAARLANLAPIPIDVDAARKTADGLLARMDAALAGARWLAGTEPTLADLALYAYTAHAPEGGVSLEPYPAVRTWLARVEDLPGFVPMRRTAVGLA